MLALVSAVPFSALTASLANPVTRDSSFFYSSLQSSPPNAENVSCHLTHSPPAIFRSFSVGWTTADHIQRASTAFKWSYRCDKLTNLWRKTNPNYSYCCEQMNPKIILSVLGDCCKVSYLSHNPTDTCFFFSLSFSLYKHLQKSFKSILLHLTQGSHFNHSVKHIFIN